MIKNVASFVLIYFIFFKNGGGNLKNIESIIVPCLQAPPGDKKNSTIKNIVSFVLVTFRPSREDIAKNREREVLYTCFALLNPQK